MSLTQEQVEALPDGTQVDITWYGHPSPVTYVLRHIPNFPYPVAAKVADDGHVAPIVGAGTSITVVETT